MTIIAMLPGGDWSILDGSDLVMFYELGDTTLDEFFHDDDSPMLITHTDATCIGTYTQARGFISTALKTSTRNPYKGQVNSSP